MLGMVRRSVLVAILGALLTLALRVRASDDDQVLLAPGAAKIPVETVDLWKQECNTKHIPRSCYNVAVNYAQNEGDEVKAIEYLRPLCKQEYVLGCFNLGGILIKETATRKEGLAAFQKACALSKGNAGTTKENAATSSACEIAGIVGKNLDADYLDIAVALGLTATAHTASFDCARASTSIEKMICSDKQASHLDFWVASYYRSAVQLSEQPDQLKAEQRAWLATQRNKCADVKCLRRSYEKRFEALKLLNAPEGTAHPKPPADDPYPASFVHPPFIKPTAVRRLTGELISDGGPKEVRVLTIDLTNPKATRKYIGESKQTKSADDDPVPYVHEDDPTDPGILQTPRFGYKWRGRTTSGVDVLLVDESGGGSMTAECVLLVKVELDTSAGKNRLLLKKVRVQQLGDRWDGDLRVIGNNVLIGEDEGRFAGDGSGERVVIKVP
jgi:uncharacterized protein